MSTFGTATDQQAIAAPAGSYKVSLKDMDTEVESDFNPDGQIKWIFEIEDVIHSSDDEADDYIGEELHGYSNKSSNGYNPRSKTRQWYEALLGRKLESDEAMSKEAVLGRNAVATVVEHERKDGTPTTKIAQEGGLQPFKERKKGKKAKPAPEPEPEEADEDDDDSDESEDFPF